MNIDTELVAQAREVLQTGNTTDTVHDALREVVRRDRLRRLAEWDLGGMTLEDLREMRRSRLETKEWGKGASGLDVLGVLHEARDETPAVDRADASPPNGSPLHGGDADRAAGRLARG